ncbi:C-terminal binding protein [Anaerosphaera multitolerans]|uniref:C-terminal binding protein n=1 Tax=Anaerosphaera multitolerans TaxID=2487351 RepID=A0A437S6R3_9FIRM|nr:C-terminal binding protein [Anaerosphaera multitolerans]RVU54720.1 C-terminal binding protein [Anaerosphaera multitolerans]
MLIWIIDEEWEDYNLEKEMLPKLLPGVEIKYSGNDYAKDLEEFGYKADGILAQVYVDIPRSTIEKLENCKGIATYGGGFDRIDIEAAKEKEIMVANVQGYCAEDLADYVLASMFYANKRIAQYSNNLNKDLEDGRWGATAAGEERHRLSNQTLLIVGFGTIGKVIGERAKSLGIEVIAYDEYFSKEDIEKYGVEKVDWEEGFKRADYVSINLRGDDSNANKIGMNEFELMKNSAYIINTSRGKIIKEEDLIKAVNEKIIAGAFLDVLKNEPPKLDDPMLKERNIIITPHISYISIESMGQLKEIAITNLVNMVKGEKALYPVY